MFATNQRSLFCESVILEWHTGGGDGSGGGGGGGYLHNGCRLLISPTVAQVSAAFVLTAAFIYSLTGGFSSPAPPQRTVFTCSTSRALR